MGWHLSWFCLAPLKVQPRLTNRSLRQGKQPIPWRKLACQGLYMRSRFECHLEVNGLLSQREAVMLQAHGLLQTGLAPEVFRKVARVWTGRSSIAQTPQGRRQTPRESPLIWERPCISIPSESNWCRLAFALPACVSFSSPDG